MYSKIIAAVLTLLVCMGINTGHSAAQEQTNRPHRHLEPTNTAEALIQEPTAAANGTVSVTVTAETTVPTETTPFTEPEIPVNRLTEEEAEAAAIAYAGFSAEDVTFFRTEPDYERGVPVWDVEFRAGDWEYDYAVHAQTGEIVKQERDYEPRRQTGEGSTASAAEPAAPAVTPNPAPQTEAVTGGNLTSDAAADIALAHAGVTRDAVRGLRVGLDRDDGVTVYEVEFRDGAVEYEYEIHAQNGTILDWDRDYDD